ncbi:cell division cycle-associated protein 4-like [Xyrauchen texanus]|uniref:cell division cycle-associated protein 4-like n=1 Tax=Xyrauchen texanus TaxID=154827 RepID=UPI0022423A69|nr:cell division cycle-associated protein 4-like [Xyrauchen texanus]
MVARGQKRKRQDEGGGSSWESQLQSVLDISMDKFHRDQTLVEPSLLRSVLINNTLRQVQSEVRVQVQSLSAVKFPTKSQTQTGLPLEPVLYQGSPLTGHNAPLYSSSADDFISYSLEEDFSLSAAISAILKDLDAVIDGGQGPCLSQRAPLGSIENVTGDGRFTQYPLSSLRTSEIASSSKTEVMYTSCPQDVALDKLLLDFDTSVFEPEVNLLGVQSFSVTNNDLVKYLPSLSKSSTSSASSSSSSISHGQATWEVHEIEHVMDILMQTYPQS